MEIFFFFCNENQSSAGVFFQAHQTRQSEDVQVWELSVGLLRIWASATRRWSEHSVYSDSAARAQNESTAGDGERGRWGGRHIPSSSAGCEVIIQESVTVVEDRRHKATSLSQSSLWCNSTVMCARLLCMLAGGDFLVNVDTKELLNVQRAHIPKTTTVEDNNYERCTFRGATAFAS